MNLFVFGLGFSGRAFAERVRGRFGTIRASAKPKSVAATARTTNSSTSLTDHSAP